LTKLQLSLLFSVIGNVIAWFHMNGQFLGDGKYDFMKSNWWVLLGGMPISFLFYYSTRMSYEHFGYFWAIRPIGFGLATITFGFLTWALLGEIPTLRIVISLILAAAIILIQITDVIQ
tara:strand:- start:541 stop:894 length:354 start_codon:yes stop_codon:yes gene_type:complete